MIDRLFRAANHHAIAALDAPDASRRAAIDVANSFFGQLFCAADIVLVEGIAAIDDNVVALKQAAETFDRFFGDLPGRQHQPNRARLLPELLDHIGKRRGSRGAVLCQRLARLGGAREYHASGVPPSSSGETCCRPFCRVRSYRSASVSLLVGIRYSNAESIARRELRQSRIDILEVDAQRAAAAFHQDVKVAAGLRRFHHAEAV